MMDVRLEQKLTIIVSKAEWLLISKALRRVLKPVEVDAAMELQVLMHRQRHEILRQSFAESQKVIDNIDHPEE
jgi:hypothetical protein